MFIYGPEMSEWREVDCDYVRVTVDVTRDLKSHRSVLGATLVPRWLKSGERWGCGDMRGEPRRGAPRGLAAEKNKLKESRFRGSEIVFANRLYYILVYI